MLDGRGSLDDIKPVRIDRSRAPLHVVHLHGHDHDGDVLELLGFWESIVHTPHAIVLVTAPRMPFVSPRHAAMYGEWLCAHDEVLQRNIAGLGLVLRSALARGVFKAIASMAPLSFTHEQLASEAEAIAWAEERMRALPRAPAR